MYTEISGTVWLSANIMKNSNTIKISILSVVALATMSFIPTARAEATNVQAMLNQQLMASLQQLIVILQQQVEELQRQLATQQQAINKINNLLPQQPAVQAPIQPSLAQPSANSSVNNAPSVPTPQPTKPPGRQEFIKDGKCYIQYKIDDYNYRQVECPVPPAPNHAGIGASA